MIPRTLTTIAVVAAAFAFAASGALAKGVPYHDQGDAVDARLAPQAQPLVVIRDHGDASDTRLALQREASPVIVRDHGDAGAARLAFQPSSIDIARDHGDAAQARLSLQSAPFVARERSLRTAIVRDHGDAAQARQDPRSAAVPSAGQAESTSNWSMDWSKLGIGVGLGILLVLGVALVIRVTRGYRLAH